MMLYQRDAACTGSGIETMFAQWVESRMEETSFWANAADMGDSWYSAMQRFINGTNATAAVATRLDPPAAAATRPAMPWNYSGWSRFPSFYFGANEDGAQAPSQVAAVARYALAGWGWQQGFKSDGGHHGEAAGVAAAAAVRRVAPRGSPGAPDALAVYRQSESLFTYYDTMSAVAANETLLAAATLRDPVSGKACGGGGLLSFSNATFAKYWTAAVGGEIASEPGVDAVFYDGFDKLYGGGTLGENGCAGFSPAAIAAELLAKVDATAAQAVVLNAGGKVPIISTYNYLNASSAELEPSDAAAVQLSAMNGVSEDAYVERLAGVAWMRFYEVWLGHGRAMDAVQVANAIAETAAGVPFVARSAVGTMHTLQYGAIGFLVAQGLHCYWGASSGWLDSNWAWSGIDTWRVGAPLGVARRESTYVWTRAFANANATIDVAAGVAHLTTSAGVFVEGRRDEPSVDSHAIEGHPNIIRPAAPTPNDALPSTSWEGVPLFAHVRWAPFSAADVAGLARFRSVTVQVEPDAPLRCEAQAADVAARLAAAGARTTTLMYGNVFYAEPNCAYFSEVAATPWLWLNDTTGGPYRPAGRFTFDMRFPRVQEWWAAHVIAIANVTGGGFGDSGCGTRPAWLPAAEQDAFAAGQLRAHAIATEAVDAASGGLYIANCPIVPAIGDKPLPGVRGEMVESWCSDFMPGKGPAPFCRDELAEAVVLAAAPNRTWVQARYYLSAHNAFNPQFGLAAFLVAASEGSFFGASTDWDWAGDWQKLLSWPWVQRPLGAPLGPPSMDDKAGCAWSRAYANATASVNVCTARLFARISWDGVEDVPSGAGADAEPTGSDAEALFAPPPFRSVVVEGVDARGACAPGAAIVAAPWAEGSRACLRRRAPETV